MSHKDLHYFSRKNENRKIFKSCLCFEIQRKVCATNEKLKTNFDHGVILEKVHRVIDFYQEASLNHILTWKSKIKKVFQQILKNIFLRERKEKCLVKLWKMSGNIEIYSL